MAKKKAKVAETKEEIIAKAKKMITSGKKMGDPDIITMGLDLLESVGGIPQDEPVEEIEKEQKGVFKPKNKNGRKIGRGDENAICRTEPYNPKKAKNLWEPPPKTSKDLKEIELDRKMTEGIEREERREAIEFLDRECEWCGKDFQIHPQIDSPVCNKCLLGGKRVGK